MHPGFLVASVLAIGLPSAATSPSTPQTPESLLSVASDRIKYVIAIMMENRSFDHLLGWLHSDGMPTVHGGRRLPHATRWSLDTCTSCPALNNTGSRSEFRHDPAPAMTSARTTPPTDSQTPCSSCTAKPPLKAFPCPLCKAAWPTLPPAADPSAAGDPSMDGFVDNALHLHHNETNPVSMFDSASTPIINTLARQFAVFDMWFCSAPTSTDPNRAFSMSGTSDGMITNYNGTHWGQESYFNYLARHNKTFRAYIQDDLWAVGYFQDMLKPENAAHIHDIDDTFFQDVASGDLPDFTWMQPRMTSHKGVPTWQHPDASVTEGERLIKQIYEALAASPVWNETMLLITYDEHGGFM
eukprot:gene11662-2119_t